MSVKRDFIEAVRLTPDGIQNFLETPIPTLSAITLPSDVDAANIAAGILSYNINLILKSFEGLTPIELLLRIGQHNNVLESAMLAGLEYIEGADSNSNLVSIVEPVEGTIYAPGEMRFIATVSNAFCIGMTLVVGTGEPVKMTAQDEQWQQYVIVEEGELSATVTATFEDNSTATATVNLEIQPTVEPEPGQPPPENPPQPPGGTDMAALDRAASTCKKAYDDLMKAILLWSTGTDVKDTVTARYQAYKTTISALLNIAKQVSPSQNAIEEAEIGLNNAYPNTSEAIYTEDIQALLNNWVPGIQSIVDYIVKICKSL